MHADWIKLTTASTGAGNIVVAQVSGFPVPSDTFSDGAMLNYVILDANKKPVEKGLGQWTVGTSSLARTFPMQTYVAGVVTKDGAAIAPATLSGGSYDVYIAATAESCAPALRGHHAITGGFAAVQGALAGLGSGSGSLIANRQYVAAYRHNTMKRLKEFSIYTGGVSGNCRFGLYRLNNNGYPDKVLVDSGSVVVTAARTFWTLPTPLSFPHDHYGVSFIVDNATASFRTCGSSAVITESPFGVNSTGDTVFGLYNAPGSLILPDPFVAGATGIVSGGMPLVNLIMQN